MGHAGYLALLRRVFPNLPCGNDDISTTDVRREWCPWALTRTEEDHPFYFADVIEDADGNVESQTVRLFVFSLGRADANPPLAFSRGSFNRRSSPPSSDPTLVASRHLLSM
jgi:hypothetical protein